MKRFFKYSLLVLLAVWMASGVMAQDKRTLATKVADVLAQFPAQNMEYADQLVKQIIESGDQGIAAFCDMLVPAGTGDDTQARYAIESLAVYSAVPGRESARSLVASSLLKAIKKANDNEVKDFLIHRLIFCGGAESIQPMGALIADSKLYAPAVAVLTTIGTDAAASEMLAGLASASGEKQISLINALGVLKYKEAVPALIKLVGDDAKITRQALWALAEIGDEQSLAVMDAAAKKAAYKTDAAEAMVSYLHYASRLAANGAKASAKKVCSNVLKNCSKPEQLHFRSGALNVMRANFGAEVTSVLLKEFKNEDVAYRNAVLIYAADGMTASEVKQWVAAAKKAPAASKVQIIEALAKRPEAEVLQNCILPALNHADMAVRNEAIAALALNQKEKALPVLLEKLDKAEAAEELAALKNAILLSVSKESTQAVADKLEQVTGKKAVLLIEVLAARRATQWFGKVQSRCNAENAEIKAAAFAALKNVAAPENLSDLLGLLAKGNSNEEVAAVQQAVIAVLQNEKADQQLVLKQMNDASMKTKLLPVLPFMNDAKAFATVTAVIKNGSSKEKNMAFQALLDWKNADAVPVLFSILENGEFAEMRDKTFATYLSQVMRSAFPNDQKLLLVRKLVPVCKTDKEKTQLIQTAGNIKTFLSLVFVAEYLDIDTFSGAAAMSAMKIMLPTPGEDNALKGEYVREVAGKVIEKLTGGDAQYFKIDLREFLEKMPAGKGFVSMFNGKDLSGWQGLVENPIARAKMKPEELAKKQAEADLKMVENWSVKDGSIVFNGKGANLCSKKMYGDFEMIADWRITKDGDSGIYLRGTPQVQIWDIARVDVGAQVGSGGLYNNKKNPANPLVLADNPVGEWNTFRITMVGDKVTVYLNGQLVVNNVTLENFWDRSLPIFPVEAIELQAHGTDLAFRNIYVREMNTEEVTLSEQEKAEGFQLLFNGKNLDGWVGNKTDYVPEDGVIAVRPKNGGHGNLFTEKEYSNFNFRFEFKLTPGANNGLGVHAPLEGDAAYVGKELQILDNTAAIYANLKPAQYHGSVYGIIAAKRGFLKPVGEWNTQEVIVKGDDFKIILNGEVIVDGNLKEASKNGTLDGKNHPGLQRHTGHIGFLGHGSELWFRNIRIKEL